MSSWWLQSLFNWHLNKREQRRVAEISFSDAFRMILGKMEQGLPASLSIPTRTTPFLQKQSIHNQWLSKNPASSGPWTKDRQELGSTGKVLVRALLIPISPGGAPRYECDWPCPPGDATSATFALRFSWTSATKESLVLLGKKNKINRMIKLVIFCSGRTFWHFLFSKNFLGFLIFFFF